MGCLARAGLVASSPRGPRGVVGLRVAPHASLPCLAATRQASAGSSCSAVPHSLAAAAAAAAPPCALRAPREPPGSTEPLHLSLTNRRNKIRKYKSKRNLKIFNRKQDNETEINSNQNSERQKEDTPPSLDGAPYKISSFHLLIPNPR